MGATTSYVIAVGSNRRGRHGSPAAEVRAALASLGGRASPIITTAPLGPSLRCYANAATMIESDEAPDALLRRLKRIERDFGRRRGQRWSARVIDLEEHGLVALHDEGAVSHCPILSQPGSTLAGPGGATGVPGVPGGAGG